MTLVIPPGYYEVAYHHTLTGSLHEAVCTFGVRYLGTTFSTDVNILSSAWAGSLLLSVADAWKYTRMTVRQQDGTIVDQVASVQGGTSHAPTTPNVAFLLKKTTARPGRRGRGRMYLPGVSEQDVDGVGNVVASKMTELGNNCAAFASQLAAGQWAGVILHNASSDPLVNTTPTNLTGFSPEPLVATQRNRLR